VRSLVDVTPSLLSALGAPGFDNRLAVSETSAVCLLLIDAAVSVAAGRRVRAVRGGVDERVVRVPLPTADRVLVAIAISVS